MIFCSGCECIDRRPSVKGATTSKETGLLRQKYACCDIFLPRKT